MIPNGLSDKEIFLLLSLLEGKLVAGLRRSWPEARETGIPYPSMVPVLITAEIITWGLMGDFKQKGDEASLWSSAHAIIVGHVEWITSYVQSQNGRNYVILRALFGFFFQGTTKHKLEGLFTEHRDTLTVLRSHRGSETLDFQESRVSLLAREQKLAPYIQGYI